MCVKTEQSQELKNKLTEMMAWFHQFCIDNNLTYYVLGGTMLGAMRHGGFIPWDDDIDVGMPREDYNKLAALLENKTVGNYLMETPNTTEKDFYYPFSKIYDTKTTLIENTKSQIKRGIYLDIFPLDGIGNSMEESEKNFKKVQRLNNYRLLKVAGFRKGRKFYKNIGVALFRLIPINAKKILKKLDRECAKFDFYDYEYCGNLVGAWGLKEIVPKDVMGTPKLYKFENIFVYGVEKPDEYLTSLYGDWRQLPPVEKRITHHDFVLCDLNKSYLED